MDRIKKWAWKLLLALLIGTIAAGLAYTFPADLAMLFALDVTSYLDAVVSVYVIAQVLRLRPLIGMARHRAIASLNRVRGRTSVSIRKATRSDAQADNDDDPAALAWAA